MNSFSVEQKRVDVFESAAPNKPVIYLNTYGREGAQIFQYLTDIGCQDFSLVAVSKLEWNHDMVPWDIPPIFKNGASYTSGADEYLRLLINQIIPKAESLLRKSTAPPEQRSAEALCGYGTAAHAQADRKRPAPAARP